MTILLVGMLLFFAPHVAAMTPLRATLLERFGERGFKGAFAFVALAGLLLTIWGFGVARAAPEAGRLVYQPAPGAAHLTYLLVLLGFILLIAAYHRGHIKRWVRQPMSIGVALWAAGHLLVNGAVHEVVLFGAFLLYAIADIAVSTARGKVPVHQPKWSHDVIAVGAGVAVYGLFVLWLHTLLIGVPAMPVATAI